jgi:hypothetical protein
LGGADPVLANELLAFEAGVFVGFGVVSEVFFGLCVEPSLQLLVQVLKSDGSSTRGSFLEEDDFQDRPGYFTRL